MSYWPSFSDSGSLTFIILIFSYEKLSLIIWTYRHFFLFPLKGRANACFFPWTVCQFLEQGINITVTFGDRKLIVFFSSLCLFLLPMDLQIFKIYPIFAVSYSYYCFCSSMCPRFGSGNFFKNVLGPVGHPGPQHVPGSVYSFPASHPESAICPGTIGKGFRHFH